MHSQFKFTLQIISIHFPLAPYDQNVGLFPMLRNASRVLIFHIHRTPSLTPSLTIAIAFIKL